MRSRFSGLASSSAALGRTGRRLAYRPRPWRRPSSPCSGRGLSGSVVSHFGPPTAASSTASALLHDSSVSSGSAVPVASIAAPPIKRSSYMRSPATSPSTSSVAASTSGPMPSPGSVTIFIAPTTLERGGDRAGALAVALVGVDRVRLLERERDVVEPVEQAVADVVVELERHSAAVEAHLARLEVDLRRAGLHQRTGFVLGQHDRQESDLGAVAEEDVGEAGCHDRAEAVVLERPRGVLARRAGAEVAAGDEDRVGRQVPAVL